MEILSPVLGLVRYVILSVGMFLDTDVVVSAILPVLTASPQLADTAVTAAAVPATLRKSRLLMLSMLRIEN
jgi:hypothetical protein